MMGLARQRTLCPIVSYISNHLTSHSLAVIVGCLPPFKALFTSRFSTSPHYNADAANSRTVGSKPNRGSRHNSIPLNSLDDGYHARAKGGLDHGYSDTESQEMIIRTNEEMGDVVMGSKDIKVERVFVSPKLSFLDVTFERHQKIPILRNGSIHLSYEPNS